jgi:hypothetical protein
VEAPTTDVAAVHSDAAAIVDATLRAPNRSTAEQSTTVDTARDASAIVEAVVEAVVDGVVDKAAAGLTDTQRAMLDFERRWWRQPGAKEQAIRDTFAMTPTRYYQSLNALLDLPGALSYDAALIHRLQRLRGAATRGRRVS